MGGWTGHGVHTLPWPALTPFLRPRFAELVTKEQNARPRQRESGRRYAWWEHSGQKRPNLGRPLPGNGGNRSISGSALAAGSSRSTSSRPARRPGHRYARAVGGTPSPPPRRLPSSCLRVDRHHVELARQLVGQSGPPSCSRVSLGSHVFQLPHPKAQCSAVSHRCRSRWRTSLVASWRHACVLGLIDADPWRAAWPRACVCCARLRTRFASRCLLLRARLVELLAELWQLRDSPAQVERCLAQDPRPSAAVSSSYDCSSSVSFEGRTVQTPSGSALTMDCQLVIQWAASSSLMRWLTF